MNFPETLCSSFILKYVDKIKVWLKSDKNNGHFSCIPTYCNKGPPWKLSWRNRGGVEVSIVQETEWASRPAWTGAKKSRPRWDFFYVSLLALIRYRINRLIYCSLLVRCIILYVVSPLYHTLHCVSVVSYSTLCLRSLIKSERVGSGGVCCP